MSEDPLELTTEGFDAGRAAPDVVVVVPLPAVLVQGEKAEGGRALWLLEPREHGPVARMDHEGAGCRLHAPWIALHVTGRLPHGGEVRVRDRVEERVLGDARLRE